MIFFTFNRFTMADNKYEIALKAITDGDLTSLKKAIKDGCEPNQVEYRNGYTLVLKAAEKGQLELLQYLVTEGGDLEQRTDTG